MKIIFLDIDGVLVNRECLMKASGMQANAHPDCVAALNYVIEQTGAGVVISSTWRLYGTISRMRDYLNKWGVEGVVCGITPDLTCQAKPGGLYLSPSRGEEIQAWLDAYDKAGREVESFVIIDDDSDMAHLSSRLVQTQFERGFTFEEANRAIELLR